MSHDTVLSVGQALEVQDALRRQNISLGDFKKITSGDWLSKLMEVIDGRAEIKMVEHIIDCDADPFTPNDFEVMDHFKCGKFKWDLTKIKLHLSPNQQDGKMIRGQKLLEELAKEPVFNAKVLDYLLEYPHLIPEGWKGQQVFFWGTIYRDSNGHLYVRCLYWRVTKWDWLHLWLGDSWGTRFPAVVST